MYQSLFDDRGLSLDRLRSLLEICDAGSIAEAAPGDPIRQSQYSRQVRELSEFFGAKLGRRQGKLLRLTDEGMRLAELVREHLRSLQDFRAECRADSSDYLIAAGDSLLQWLVIPRLGTLIKGKKAIRFVTDSLRTHEIIRQLGNGRIDVGVVRKNAVGSGLVMGSLGMVAYCVIVPRQLITSGIRPALRDILGNAPMAIQTTDGEFTRRLRETTVSLGIAFRPALSCQSFPQAASAVKSGLFASVLPKLAASDFPNKGFVCVEDTLLDRLNREIVLAWNPRITRVRPGAAHLLEQMQRHFSFGD